MAKKGWNGYLPLKKVCKEIVRGGEGLTTKDVTEEAKRLGFSEASWNTIKSRLEELREEGEISAYEIGTDKVTTIWIK